jgi:DNA invertase Pin-like site-specific DNA recombinase
MKKKIRQKTPKTCAIYAQCASASEESIRAQIQNSTAEARNQGLAVADEHVSRDDGRSGLSDRPALNALLEVAEKASHPIDLVIVDDTSRLGRRLDHVLSLHKRLAQASVRIHILGVGMSKNEALPLALAENCGHQAKRFQKS